MKAVKILAVLVLVYVAVVIAFESGLGYFQPQNADTLVMISNDAEGNEYNRVLSRIESDNKIYVSVNHWPRAWYYRVLDNPDVKITYGSATTDAVAIPITGAEFESVNADRALPLVFRVLTGFPPRRILRLEPVLKEL